MEQGHFSLTRIAPTAITIVYLCCCIYGTVTGKTWGGFEHFTDVEVACVLALLGNKLSAYAWGKDKMAQKEAADAPRHEGFKNKERIDNEGVH